MTWPKLKGVKFFALVLLLYCVLFFINPDDTKDALQICGTILTKLLPVFLAVILLTALINYFFKPKQIVKHFGKESGLLGWVYALLAGVISHGPMYAWYPMIEEMRSHGLRSGLIAAFFYARAIKLPLLPLMIDYFGWLFTIILSTYILVASFIQGKAIELCLKED